MAYVWEAGKFMRGQSGVKLFHELGKLFVEDLMGATEAATLGKRRVSVHGLLANFLVSQGHVSDGAISFDCHGQDGLLPHRFNNDFKALPFDSILVFRH